MLTFFEFGGLFLQDGIWHFFSDIDVMVIVARLNTWYSNVNMCAFYDFLLQTVTMKLSWGLR